MSFAPQTLIKFLKRELAFITEEGPITSVRLWHVADVDNKSPLCEKTVSSESIAEDLAQELTDIAQQHVDASLSSNQERYVVESRVASSDTVHGHIPFVLTCNSPNKLNLEPSDPPNEKGYHALMAREITQLRQQVNNFVTPILNNQSQRMELENKRIELEIGLMRAKEAAINEDFERKLKHMRLQREFDKEDQPKPRNILGEKLLEMGLPMLAGQIGKSFPNIKEAMAGISNQESNGETSSDQKTKTNNQEPNLIDILEFAGEEESVIMMRACNDKAKQACLYGIILQCFYPPPGATKPVIGLNSFLDYLGFEEVCRMANACENETFQTAIRGMIEQHFHKSPEHAATGQTAPTNNKEGHNGQSEESTQEDIQAQEQRSSKAKRGSSQENASRPAKVSSRARASQEVSRVVRKAKQASKEAPKEGRQKAHSKTNGKAHSKTNGKAPKTNKRSKTSSRQTSYA